MRAKTEIDSTMRTFRPHCCLGRIPPRLVPTSRPVYFAGHMAGWAVGARVNSSPTSPSPFWWESRDGMKLSSQRLPSNEPLLAAEALARYPAGRRALEAVNEPSFTRSPVKDTQVRRRLLCSQRTGDKPWPWAHASLEHDSPTAGWSPAAVPETTEMQPCRPDYDLVPRASSACQLMHPPKRHQLRKRIPNVFKDDWAWGA